MNLRALCLALVASACFAPAANAALADRYVPLRGDADGIHIRGAFLRFDVGSGQRSYNRWFAGREYSHQCSEVRERGETTSVSLIGGSPRTAKRGKRTLEFSGGDVCTYATRPRGRSDAGCLPENDVPGNLWCVRLVIASNELGRVRVDQFQRRLELSMAMSEEDPFALGPDVVALPDAEAAPPPGKVGVFQAGPKSRTVSVVEASGRRRFLRSDDGVFTTNVGHFVDWSNRSASSL